MGWLDRITEAADDAWDRGFEVARGGGRTLKATGDWVADLAEAPFTDDEYGGFFATIFDSSTRRASEAAGALFGPETGLGAAIGAIPQGARDALAAPVEGAIVGAGGGAAVGSVVPGVGTAFGALVGAAGGFGYGAASGRSAFDDSETVFREGISEPITTALTAGSLADAPGGGGALGLFRPDNWRRGYEIAQDRSPGQALALAIGTRNIQDPVEVEQFKATDAYARWSAVADGVLRLTADPTVLLGRATSAARVRGFVTDASTGQRSFIRLSGNLSPDDIAKARNSTQVSRFIEAIDGLDAAGIRSRYFPDHADGGYISTLLAGNPVADPAAQQVTRRQVLGALMGSADDYLALMDGAPDVAHQLRNLSADASEAARREAGNFAPEGDYARLTTEMEALYPDADRYLQIEETFGVIDEVPRYSRTADTRSTIASSRFYQKNPLTAPLRTVSNMLPQRWLNLNDQRSDIQLARMLRDSDLDGDAQGAIRSEYMAATSPAARQMIAVKAEEAATRSVLETYGVKAEVVDDILAHARVQRGNAMGALRGRKYDGKGRGSIDIEDQDGGLTRVHLPLHVTQQADLLPAVDIRGLRRAAQVAQGWNDGLASPAGIRGKAREAATSRPVGVSTELLEHYYALWRPITLLRVGWPIRVVADEQLRIIATIGAMTQGRNLGRAVRRDVAQRAQGLKSPRKLQRDALKPGPKGEWARGDIALGKVRRGSGYHEVSVGEYTAPPAFGNPGDAANYFQRLNSSSSSLREMIAPSGSAGFLAETRERTGSFRTFMPQEQDYALNWERAVNRQIAKASLPRQIMAGKTVDEAIEWLSKTDEGMAYAREANWRPHTFRQHVEDAAAQVEDYLPTVALRRIALQRPLTYDDLMKARPDIDTHPLIHGEELAQAIGKSDILKGVQSMTRRLWESLGTVPSDVLSRNPFFDHQYQSEVRRLIPLREEVAARSGRTLDQADIDAIAGQARKKALTESQNLLYDLAEKSQFAHMLRFVSPFYMAWQEVTTAWTGLAIKDPAFIARARLVWNSPEKAGIVTDENGMLVDEDGTATDPLTGNFVKPGADRFITLPFEIPGLNSRGPVRFNKKSLNMALSGTPGFGPPVQYAANEIVKQRPELEESLKFVLPFGASGNSLEILMPTAAKRLWAQADGTENRLNRNNALRIYSDMKVDYELGKQDIEPTWEEAVRRSESIGAVRTVASFVLPFAPIIDSPYQSYINSYRNAQERLRDDEFALGVQDNGQPVGADEWFLDTFGEEYFWLTMRMTETNNGVAPTVEAARVQNRMSDLIDKHPDLGGLIVGADGAGEFSKAIYYSQLETETTPGSGVMERSALAPLDAIANPDVSLGWMKYGRAMDLIDAERIKRGLPNLQVKAAADLADMKRQITAGIENEHPEWSKEFNVRDGKKWERKITGLREIANDPRMRGREEMAGLRDYFQARDALVGELSNRAANGGAGSLSAVSNQDLVGVWASITGAMVERNLAFGDLFYRYLERDPLTGAG